MGLVSSESRVCGSCRGHYYSWKDKNPDLDELLSRLEDQEMDDTESECQVKYFLLHLNRATAFRSTDLLITFRVTRWTLMVMINQPR